MDIKEHYQLIVIGGGPAGYSAAARGSQLGASVLLVEKAAMGGTCLNWGCIPTKFFWEVLNLEKKIQRSQDYGITTEIKERNFTTIHQKKNKTIELLGKSLRRVLESYSIDIAEGIARFTGQRQIEVKLADGSARSVTADNIIIAAGSRPRSLLELPLDHQRIIDSYDALALTEVPRSLVIVGGGAIGVEMATIFTGFGSEVHLIEREKQLLPEEDAELAEEVRKTLVRAGVKVSLNVTSLGEIMNAEKILVVVGRQSNADQLDLENGDIRYNKKGVMINEYFETSSSGVYACGDVTGNSYLAYIAQEEGMVAAENAMGQKNIPDYFTIPKVAFSHPVVASVGIKESDISRDLIIVGRFPLSANSRAFIEGDRSGWVKIMAEKSTGRIMGGQVIGSHAEDLIATISLAIKYKLTVQDLSRKLFFHPSLAEAIYGACEDSMKKCVDLPKNHHG
jgi:dihydrolipoamide dehydrogenase